MTERPLFRERRKNQLLRGENSAASRDKCSFQSLLQDLPKALQEAVHDTVAACQPRYRPSLHANDWLEELYHEAACAACYALAKYDPSKGDLYAFGVLVIQRQLQRFCDRVWAAAKHECAYPHDEETGEEIEFEDPRAQEALMDTAL